MPVDPFWSKADKVMPDDTDQRTITLAFDSAGNVTRPYPDAGTASVGTSIDEERIHEVRLNSILIKTLAGTTINSAVQFQLNGDNNLPAALGYGPGQKHGYVYLLGTDFTAATVTTFRKLILASDIEGRIRFGLNPTAKLIDGESGAALTWDYIYVELLVTYRHAQKTFGQH